MAEPENEVDVSRRRFLSVAAATLAGAWFPASAGEQPDPGDPDLSSIPNFCAHEHWGSIGSIGTFEDGFRADAEAGAMPRRRTTLLDILLDPYLGGWLRAGGADIDTVASRPPAKAFAGLAPALDQQKLVGAYQCIRRGIDLLYRVDLARAGDGDVEKLDAAIGDRYAGVFGWYQEAMRAASFTKLIRPVHPEFFYQAESPESAARERAFTNTILRIDPLLNLWPARCPRRDRLASMVGVEPRDAASWRAFIARLLDHAATRGLTGIKQYQAYSRDLDFAPRADAEISFTGELDPNQRRALQDWIVNECCKQANDRGWPHQVHVGTHNLARSSPLPLEHLARRYPRMKLVQIHCWPFLDEAGWLAKHIPNVYLDTCWQVVLSPAFFKRALRTWLNYVPLHRIMCSHDSTSVEMAAGSSLFTREILKQALAKERKALGLEDSWVLRAARDLLHNNAVNVYGIGDRV